MSVLLWTATNRMAIRRGSMIMSANNGKAQEPPAALFVRQRNEQGDAILAADATRDVALAGHIFRQKNVSRPERDLLPAVELHPALAAQRDDVLPRRSRRPVLEVIGRLTPELQSGDLDHLRELPGSGARGKFHVDLLAMRLPVSSGEDSCDDDRLAWLSHGHVTIGARIPDHQDAADEQH